jgi:hypothetical protein
MREPTQINTPTMEHIIDVAERPMAAISMPCPIQIA